MIIQPLNTNLIINADCLTALKKLPDNSVDSIVTDPPYGLGFMGKQWDTFDNSQFGTKGEEGENDLKVKKNFKILPRYNSDGLYTFTKEWATECLRVLKPGGYLLCFSGTRNYHKICMGIEDADFEIRDMISWLYGSGFPKSLNIGKQIDKIQGNEREVVGKKTCGYQVSISKTRVEHGHRPNLTKSTEEVIVDKGNSQYEGWGTALKPACEPIVVARKPLSEKNVALNCLKWGTGGINIDGCRVGNEIIKSIDDPNKFKHFKEQDGRTPKEHNFESKETQGRFPANIILDEEAGNILDEQSGIKKGNGHWSKTKTTGFGEFGNGKSEYFGVGEKDNLMGGASRFFYCAKASKSERNLGCEEMEDKLNSKMFRTANNTSDKICEGFERFETLPSKNNHPTVKPLKLMRYLVRLVTPKGGVCLDPFIGSGTTACACIKEGMNYIGIEKEEDYIKIANARIKAVEDSLKN